MNSSIDSSGSREQRIITSICQFLDVDWDTLRSRARDRELAEGRQLLCYVLLQAGYSPAQIARSLERNHSTVVHALGRVQQRPTAVADGRWLAEQVLPMTPDGSEARSDVPPVRAISLTLVRLLIGSLSLAETRAVRAYVCTTLLGQGQGRGCGAMAAWGLCVVSSRQQVRRAVYQVLDSYGLGAYRNLIEMQARRMGLN